MPNGIAFGRYQLFQRLAIGGMAELFLAQVEGEGNFRKTCVVKRVLPHLSSDPKFVKMFLREGRLVASLDHPNIVQVFDFGRVEDDYFLAMEYLAGEDLAEVISRARDAQAAVPISFALQVVRDACAALDYAHNVRSENGLPLGLVHRDISPSNLLVTYHGNAKVLDFGIARETGDERHTATTEVRGKPSYMAPEQLLKEPIDARADVWALGVVLYELLTGRRPFTGRSAAEIAVSVSRETPIPPSSLREGLPPMTDAVLAKALARRAGSRFGSARELQDALQGLLTDLGANDGPAGVASFLRELFGEDRAEQKLRAKSFFAAPGVAGTVPHEGPPEVPTTLERRKPPVVSVRQKVAFAVAAVVAIALGAVGVTAMRRQGDPPEVAPSARPAVAEATPTPTSPPTPVVTAPVDAGAVEVAAAITAVDAGASEEPPAEVEPPVVAAVVAPSPRPSTTKRSTSRTPADAYVSVRSTVQADVFVGRRKLGRLPLNRVAIPAGTKSLRISNPALGIDKQVKINASAGKETVVDVAFGKGRLNINAQPWADVWLDGVHLGQTPVSREVFEGVHRVKLVGATKQKTSQVVVRADLTSVVQEDLR